MHASTVHTVENLLNFASLRSIVSVGAARPFGWPRGIVGVRAAPSAS